MNIVRVMIGACLVLVANVCLAGDIRGSIVPPFPKGWKDQGGACIGGPLGFDKICEYSIGVLEEGSQLVLYIGKSAPPIDAKTPRWLVTDQMPYPKAPAGFHVVLGSCERDGTRDETIIAIVKTTDTEGYDTVRSAFHRNLSTGRFERTSTTGMRCRNEGWGV